MKNQPSTFDRTSNFIINHIQKIYKNGHDIAETLNSMKEINTSVWFPVIFPDTETDPDQESNEKFSTRMNYLAEMSAAVERKNCYESNLYNAYSLLWEHCTHSLQT